MTQKPPPAKPTNQSSTTGSATPAKPKKKLSLDISDVSEVLERKISP
jgi:hypothetical protein